MIKARGVSVSYRTGLTGRFRALEGFDFSLEKGDIFGLLGHNGAGKSTAMYCFLGLIKPDAGMVRVMGEEISPGCRLFGKISYLPEEAHYHAYLTVEESVRYYSGLYGMNLPAGRGEDLLRRFGLWDFRKMKLSHCSKGMKQKVGIVQALLNESAELILLDEPTRGLDPSTTRDFRDCLLELNRRGATILLNSHILSEVEMVCNRIAIMSKGRVIVQDELNRLVGVREDMYEVEFEARSDVPEFVKESMRTSSTVRGQVETPDLRAFLDYAERGGIRIYQCALKRISLEDVFSKAMEGER